MSKEIKFSKKIEVTLEKGKYTEKQLKEKIGTLKAENDKQTLRPTFIETKNDILIRTIGGFYVSSSNIAIYRGHDNDEDKCYVTLVNSDCYVLSSSPQEIFKKLGAKGL